MGKFDVSKRIQRGIQPGLAPIPPKRIQRGIQPGLAPIPPNMNMMQGMMGNKTGMPVEEGPALNSNPLLAPSFEDVMNKKPMMDNAINKHAIGTKPNFMNRMNNQ